MKRKKLIKHLRNHGCEQLREGGKHSWWCNKERNRRTSIPRHTEIVDILAIKICKDLGIPSIKK